MARSETSRSRSPESELSEGQKTCLRLVAQGMTSKEIAQQTGLAPQTVDTYLKVALARLDVTNRREAARRLVAWELSQKSGSPSGAVAGEPSSSDPPSRTGGKTWRTLLGLPPVGGALHDLTWARKTYLALRVAFISAAGLSAVTLVIAGLFWTLSEIG